MIIRTPLTLAGLFLLLAAPALQAEQEVLYNQVYLQTSARQAVDNDRLTALLAVEEQGTAPDQIATRVNQTMRWALEQAGAVKAVEAHTGSYRTVPVYRSGTIASWRSSQYLQLQSTDFTALSELVGRLQQRLQVRQMQFSVSPGARDKVEDALIDQALDAFQQRARRVQKHMPGKDYRIINLRINSSGPPRPVLLREQSVGMAATRAPASPALEAGTSEVSVTVSGSVQYY